eukprot:m.531411 g.531411  ORF g.531411 m.531411 type:complete len:599 (+) comp22034_c0_seq1:92-1888(+)
MGKRSIAIRKSLLRINSWSVKNVLTLLNSRFVHFNQKFPKYSPMSVIDTIPNEATGSSSIAMHTTSTISKSVTPAFTKKQQPAVLPSTPPPASGMKLAKPAVSTPSKATAPRVVMPKIVPSKTSVKGSVTTTPSPPGQSSPNLLTKEALIQNGMALLKATTTALALAKAQHQRQVRPSTTTVSSGPHGGSIPRARPGSASSAAPMPTKARSPRASGKKPSGTAAEHGGKRAAIGAAAPAGKPGAGASAGARSKGPVKKRAESTPAGNSKRAVDKLSLQEEIARLLSGTVADAAPAAVAQSRSAVVHGDAAGEFPPGTSDIHLPLALPMGLAPTPALSRVPPRTPAGKGTPTSSRSTKKAGARTAPPAARPATNPVAVVGDAGVAVQPSPTATAPAVPTVADVPPTGAGAGAIDDTDIIDAVSDATTPSPVPKQLAAGDSDSRASAAPEAPPRILPLRPRTLPAVLLGWDADSSEEDDSGDDERLLSPYACEGMSATGTSTALARLLDRVAASVNATVPGSTPGRAHRQRSKRTRTTPGSEFDVLGMADTPRLRKCPRVAMKPRCVHCNSVMAPSGRDTCTTCATLDDCAVVLRLHAMF